MFAVVTAGASAIGREIVLSFARAGYDIAFTHFGAPEAAADLAGRVSDLGQSVRYWEADAGSDADTQALWAELTDWRGAPDAMINNAGIQTWSSLLDLNIDQWDAVIRTNLRGTFLNTQAAARAMIAAGKGGSIVNLGSGCNKLAFPKLVDYTASKGGIEQLTKVSAVELGPHGIRVNCVAPGAIATERTAAEAGDYDATWSRVTPLRRVGTPADIAGPILFLCGPDASFISGQTIWVDGGVFSQATWPYET